MFVFQESQNAIYIKKNCRYGTDTEGGGQDFKDKVCKSLLNVFETAFQEEVSRSHTDPKSVDTSQSVYMSVNTLNTQV